MGGFKGKKYTIQNNSNLKNVNCNTIAKKAMCFVCFDALNDKLFNGIEQPEYHITCSALSMNKK